MKPHAFALALSAILVIPTSLASQRRNATLQARFDPSTSYSDIWGYVSPSGKELAIIGATPGIYVVDCTDPANPVQRAFYSSPSSGLRDIRTYRNYIYAVSEGSGGVLIIDVADPDNPRRVGVRGSSVFSSAHNVAIDTQTGTLYPCGTSNGMPIFDISADPENPVLLANYSSNYVHDLSIQDGVAHLCEIFSGRYRAMDVSRLPQMNTIGTASVRVCHNSWPTRDNQLVVTTSETSGVGFTLLDISNQRLPRQVSTWRTTASGTIHNAYIRDRVVHCSYYSDGYRAVDISDPANPVEVAFYDTSSAWGTNAFMPSGTVYVSDISRGLYVIDTPATTRLYGAATTGGSTPTIHTYGAAYAGNSRFQLEVDDGPPNASATLLLSRGAADIDVGGVRLLVDPAGLLVAVQVTTDANGRARIPVPLAGGFTTPKLYAQFFVADGGAPLGLAGTRGMEFEVFLR